MLPASSPLRAYCARPRAWETGPCQLCDNSSSPRREGRGISRGARVTRRRVELPRRAVPLRRLVANRLRRAPRRARLSRGRSLGGRRAGVADALPQGGCDGPGDREDDRAARAGRLDPHRRSARRRGTARCCSRPIERSSRSRSRAHWRPEALGRPARAAEGGRVPPLRARANGRAWTRAPPRPDAMFDLRYHVASLAAVFLALVIGILVGVGISSGGFVQKGERRILNDEIDGCSAASTPPAREPATCRARSARRTTYVEESYPLLMADRLAGRRVALVFVGPVDAEVRDLVERTLVDGGSRRDPAHARDSRPGRHSTRSTGCSTDRPGLARYGRPNAARELGRRLAQELVRGGKAPVWRLLSPQLVEERSGNDGAAADAIVVARSVAAAAGPYVDGCSAASTRDWRRAASRLSASRRRRPRRRRSTRSTRRACRVSISWTPQVGRLALAVLLAGGRPGQLRPQADGDRRHPAADRGRCSRPPLPDER